jgi:hypothetical protein
VNEKALARWGLLRQKQKHTASQQLILIGLSPVMLFESQRAFKLR